MKGGAHASWRRIYPEQPIGLGAEWEVKLPMKMMGMTIDQTVRYELLELDGDIGKLKVGFEIDVSGSPTFPGMPLGIKVEFDKFEGEGDGTMAFDLTNLVPQSDAAIKLSIEASFSGPGSDGEMSMDADLKVKIYPVGD